ncbi:type II toxin-antitoxin system RelE/ParE family toxin [Thiorhodococcus minor]|uniref:Type II toxin-antitoxin system RelE/ParE family toxin n=1 Tax=Thiorhodococcus minor TaxID=57489 RepID=A0A6M0JYD3_9GAMM|nr:type II toxin-antitoxin system RelE/ParE family toxin [Thiorhodococcus minor]NEV62031.1 type II toxin-antitoxin system RelE/ParE family toxin [Thiorhodococcus minor]
MAGELIWSRTALDDIEAIAAWIARDSNIHACALVERMLESGEALLQTPSTARLLLELDGTRIFAQPAGAFHLIYERQGEDFHVLAIIHGDPVEQSR